MAPRVVTLTWQEIGARFAYVFKVANLGALGTELIMSLEEIATFPNILP